MSMRNIMRRIPLLLLCLLLTGQEECEEEVKPEGASEFCWGVPDSGEEVIILNPNAGPEVGYHINTIKDGNLSIDRRSTAYLRLIGRGGCSAVIIGPHTVMSAGHCHSSEGFRLYLDKQDMYDNNDNYFESHSYAVHADYTTYSQTWDQSYNDADIMMVYFPAELPGPYPHLFFQPGLASTCETIISQGWGLDENKKANTLREKEYTLIGQEARRWQTMPVDKAGTGCYGDSGGPLYAKVEGEEKLYLIGVFSGIFDIDCSSRNSHSNNYAHREWIADHLDE
jgi:V8-like Glu-specific endopeptidase